MTVSMLKVAEDVSELTGNSMQEVMFAFLGMTTVDEEEYVHMFVDLIDRMEKQ